MSNYVGIVPLERASETCARPAFFAAHRDRGALQNDHYFAAIDGTPQPHHQCLPDLALGDAPAESRGLHFTTDFPGQAAFWEMSVL